MGLEHSDPVQKVLETKWFSIEAMPFGPSGGEPYYRLSCEDAVAVLALTLDQRIVLVRQFRPAIGETVIELPSGQVEETESPEQAIIRELQEETGYVCDSTMHLGGYRISTSRINNYLHLFFGKGARDTHSKQDQDTEVVLVTKDELLQLITNGEYVEVGGLATFFLAQQKGRL